MTLPPTCRWTGPTTPRVVVRRHLDPPPEDHPPECRGCLPCRSPHCGIDGSTHTTTDLLVCPACIGAVRADLDAITRHYAALPTEAWHRGSPGGLHGGDAMVMLGPGSNDSQPNAIDESNADPVPPLLVVEGWAQVWRDELGHREPDGPATVEQACIYLAGQLDAAASLANRDCDLPTVAGEIHTLRTRLEDVLHDGIRDERGAPCLDCGAMLVRRSEPPAPAKRHDRDQGGLRDRWDCPRCHRVYGYVEYHLAVRGEYLKLAPALTAEQLAEELDVKAGTVRAWATRGLVQRRGRDQDGRVLYDAEQARAHVGTSERVA